MKKGTRLLSIDLIRIMAFAGVFFSHVFAQALQVNEKFSWNFTIGKFSIPAVACALFFLVSGFGLMKPGEFSAKDFYFRRLKRLMIPYWIVILLTIFWRFLVYRNFSFLEGLNAWNWIFTLTGLSTWLCNLGIPMFSLGVGEWFIGCLIVMYLLFPLLRKLMLKFTWKMLLVYGIFYLIYIAFYPFSHVPYVDFFAKLWPFLIGMYLKLNRPKKEVILPLACISAGLILLSMVPFSLLREVEIEYFISLDAVLVFFLFLPLDRDNRENLFTKGIQFLAGIEYEMFLFHHIILLEMGRWWNPWFLSKKKALLFVMIAAMLTLIFGWGLKTVIGLIERKRLKK